MAAQEQLDGLLSEGLRAIKHSIDTRTTAGKDDIQNVILQGDDKRVWLVLQSANGELVFQDDWDRGLGQGVLVFTDDDWTGFERVDDYLELPAPNSLTKLDEILKDGAGSYWDPAVVEAFFQIRDDIREISSRERANWTLDVRQWT